ncbi:short-chain dehydrogenase/reductase 2 [Blastomyces dermatitidis ATCC 18188]|uniref:Short-chain dehydrogenase/reductase 3 n=1 Tax=Ajellomyces dermatitidis (strain ATCC 18188 / CBS 674.68) TaxID=653446 RepID=F2TS29_AJEDA|nr:short-chain dehydrogenase/reductase 2 [Blastomyces dermatitidis ATCC 18188]
MSALQQPLDILRPYIGTTLDPLLSYLNSSPLLKKALIAALALGFLRTINRTLSSQALNNWQSQRPWDNKRELVLVTGGCSGIGKQIMLDLAQRGVRVVILDLNEPDFKLPPNVFFYAADVTSTASIKAVGDAIRAAHGDPTVLINNAGVGYEGTILDEPEERIQRTFQVNTISHFWMVREFLPAMIRENHGHVITIASMASFVALGEMADYAGSKASALAFHESLTQELRMWYKAKKVRTSIIHPLWVATPMIQQLTKPGTVFNMPTMTVDVVSNAVVKQILSQRSGQVVLPTRRSGLRLLRAFPMWLQERARGIGSMQLKALRDIDVTLQ